MGSRSTYGPTAIRMTGLIFAPTGVVALTVAVILWFSQPGFEGLSAFAILGPAFSILGLAFLLVDRKKCREAAELMENGRSVWGEIVSVESNPLIRINGSYAWFARVRYWDGLGKVYTFASRSYARRTPRELVGRKVKVYVDRDYRRGYVDLESAK